MKKEKQWHCCVPSEREMLNSQRKWLSLIMIGWITLVILQTVSASAPAPSPTAAVTLKQNPDPGIWNYTSIIVEEEDYEYPVPVYVKSKADIQKPGTTINFRGKC